MKKRAVMLVGTNEMSVVRVVRVPTLTTRPFLLPKIVLGRLEPVTRSRGRNEEDLGGRRSALWFDKVQQCAKANWGVVHLLLRISTTWAIRRRCKCVAVWSCM